jgi:hypothetical protein
VSDSPSAEVPEYGDAVAFRWGDRELTGILLRSPERFDWVTVRTRTTTFKIPSSAIVGIVEKRLPYVRRKPKYAIKLVWYGRFSNLNGEPWKLEDVSWPGVALQLPQWASQVAEEHSIAISYVGRIGGVRLLKGQAQSIVDTAITTGAWPFPIE